MLTRRILTTACQSMKMQSIQSSRLLLNCMNFQLGVSLSRYLRGSAGQVTSVAMSERAVTIEPARVDTDSLPSILKEKVDSLMASEQLYTYLRRASVEEVLELVQQQVHKLDRVHLALCLKACHKRLLQFELGDRAKYVSEMKSNSTFKLLTAKVCEKSPHFDAVMIRDMVVFLHDFHYDSSSLPMKILLQLAKYHLSDLTLDQLASLGECIAYMSPTSQTKLLQQGIITLLPFKHNELPYLSLLPQISFLCHFGKHMDDTLLNKVLFSIGYEKEALHRRYSLRLLDALAELDQCKVGKHAKFVELLDHCTDVVYKHLDRLDTDELPNLCQNLVILPVDQDMMLSILLYAGESVAKSNEVSTTDRFRVLKVLWGESLLNGHLLERVTEECVKSPLAISPKDWSLLISFLYDAPDISVEIHITELDNVLQHIMNDFLVQNRDAGREEDLYIGLHMMKQVSIILTGSSPDWLNNKLHTAQTFLQDSGQRLALRNWLIEPPLRKIIHCTATQVGYGITDLAICGQERPLAALVLDHMLYKPGMREEENIAVVVVHCSEKFKNTNTLRRSLEDILCTLISQRTCKILLIDLEKYYKIPDCEKQRWLLHRLTHVDDFQSVNSINYNV